MAISPIYAIYLLSFGLAGAFCFLSLLRTPLIEDSDTRRGLRGLLVLSGGWATAQLGYLLVPTTGFKLAFYYGGLIFGIAAVGAWLYFCSAYTGRQLHRSAPMRRFIAGVIGVIILIKLTNPLHGLYFQSATASTPFSHLAIQHGMIHWVTMGLAYALAIVGYFMLLELFWGVDKETTPLLALIAITGLPVVFDILGVLSTQLLNMTYAPLGVGIFAVGVLFVFLEDFQTVQLAGEHDDPIIAVTQTNHVRDFNSHAKSVFPDLEVGEPLDAVAPHLTNYVESGKAVIPIIRPGGKRYYQLSTNPFTNEQSDLGKAIILTDITEREQYRRELERQNERLERFASIISHDLRNPLNVATLQIDTAMQTADSERESLEAANNALERMNELIDRLLTLARQGESIDSRDAVKLSTVVTDAWDVIDTKQATLTVDSDCTILADRSRLQQLIENLFRNAIDHGNDDVLIRVGALSGESGFYVADDGPGIPEGDRETVFDFGYSSDAEGTGFGLAIVEEIASAHDWSVTVTEGNDGGARFEIRGVEFSEEWNRS